MNEIWEMIQPYVVAFAQTGLGTAIVYVLCRVFVSKWFQKNDLNNLVNGFASKLAGSTINVDLTAVAERKLSEIEVRLSSELVPLIEQLKEMKHVLAMIGTALSRSRTLTEEERAALVDAVNAVETGFAPAPKTESIVVKLASATESEQVKKSSGARMG